MQQEIEVLIIGAGPYGLSLGVYFDRKATNYLIAGKPMESWKSNMPKGMLLRSDSTWHIDPFREYTFEAFLKTKGLQPDEVEPISRSFFLDYISWVLETVELTIDPRYVSRLDRRNGRFEALMEDGTRILADKVIISAGFSYFKHIPENVLSMLPPGRYSHTFDSVAFDFLKDKRCLIIGGRQSAFEWAALALESGCKAIDMSYRHETPQFEIADWSWIPELADKAIKTPDWFRSLPEQERESIKQYLYTEGRLKLEPWLGPRLESEKIRMWSKTNVTGCRLSADDSLVIRLDNGQAIEVDHVLFATGYKVNIHNIPYLSSGNIIRELRTEEGFPRLDPYFQSNVPGLFFTSTPAMRDFGPFFGFLVGTPAASRVIGDYLTANSGVEKNNTC